MLRRLRSSAIRAVLNSDRLVNLASRGRSEGPDAVLDRQIAAILEYQRIARLPALDSLDPVRARVFSEQQLADVEIAAESMAHVTDTTVGEQRTPVRIFEPHGAGRDWFVWLHGGGGVIGSINGSERVCRYFAAHTRHTVASVGYRLGPEDKHPCAIDDACAAWEALLARVPDDARVIVGGDSFGGFLAAHVDHWAREAGVRQPDLQVLVYPVVDLRLITASVDRLAEGYLLTKAMMQYFRGHYLNDTDDPLAASPNSWRDVTGSAPALVVTAGFDPLVDDGDRWAERLREAGVTVHHRRYDSLVHGFVQLAGVIHAARAALDEMCQEIVESPAW